MAVLDLSRGVAPNFFLWFGQLRFAPPPPFIPEEPEDPPDAPVITEPGLGRRLLLKIFRL